MSDTAAGPKSRTLAILALIAAGASLPIYLKSFPDFIFYALGLGVVGVILSVAALLRARKSTAESLGWAIAAVIVAILLLGVLAAHLFLFSVLFMSF